MLSRASSFLDVSPFPIPGAALTFQPDFGEVWWEGVSEREEAEREEQEEEGNR